MTFRRFTRTNFLTEIGKELLGTFFARFETELAEKSIVPPEAALADDRYYPAVAKLFMAPAGLPRELNEAMLAIDALSTESGEDQLDAALVKAKFERNFITKTTRADLAMQVWLANPKLLAQVYNEARLIRVSSFEFHGTAAPLNRSKMFQLPGPERHTALVSTVDIWCQTHTRGEGTVAVAHHEIDGEHWFLVRHGDTFTRTQIVEQEETVLHFPPAKDDVIVYSPEFDELRIHAATKGEKELYRTAFGKYLHNDGTFFSVPKTYVLDRLRTEPEEGMKWDDFPEIEWIRLVELEIAWPGGFKDRIVKKSKDIFGSAAARQPPKKPFPETGILTRAKFEIRFREETKPQMVTVTPNNELKVARHCDARLVHRWLSKREFCKAALLPATEPPAS